MNEEKFFDRTFDYPFSPPNGQLSAGQLLFTQQSIDVDADFYFAAWVVKSTGSFTVQLTDADGYKLQNVPISSETISTLGPIPQVISPAHRIPAGGRIQIRIEDTSGAVNDVQIIFRGWKRIRRPVAQKAA